MRSVSKLKVYVPVLTMSLGYVLTVLVEARSGLKFPGPPTFASGLCLSCRVIMGWWVENAKVVKKFKDKSLAFWKHHWNHWKRYQTLRASVLNLLSMKRITQKSRKGSEFRMSGSCVIFFNGLLSQTIHVLYTYHIISHTHNIYNYIYYLYACICENLQLIGSTSISYPWRTYEVLELLGRFFCLHDALHLALLACSHAGTDCHGTTSHTEGRPNNGGWFFLGSEFGMESGIEIDCCWRGW